MVRDQRAEEMYRRRCAGETLEQVAAASGVTRERVRQIMQVYERKHGLSSAKEQCLDARAVVRVAKKQTRQEVAWQLRHQRPNSVPEISLDAHLVGKFSP